ncbi:WbqC family protein [Arthrospira platensis SPKY2]
MSWDINWMQDLLKTIEISYKRAPYFKEVYPLINRVFKLAPQSISELAQFSIVEVLKYLNMKIVLFKSSERYDNSHLKKTERLIDICKHEKAQEYINPIGGIEIYTKEDFLMHGIKLHFIKSTAVEYKQFNNSFIPRLSIIDVLMFNSIEKVQTMLNQYELI